MEPESKRVGLCLVGVGSGYLASSLLSLRPLSLGMVAAGNEERDFSSENRLLFALGFTILSGFYV